jgi:ADP-heptose:LPS heptosyltransferase
VTRALERQGRSLTLLAIRLGAMGDVLRTLPPVRLIRRALPDARIFWVVEDRWSVVLEDHPDLDGTVTLPRREWDRLVRSPVSWPRLLSSLGRARRALRRVRADLVVDFHGNLRSGLFGWMSGAGVRLGHSGHQQKEGNALFTTHRVPSGDRRTPRMERNLDLVRGLGLPVRPLPAGGLPMVDAGREAAEQIVRLLPAHVEGYAVLSPGASLQQAYKKPPTEMLAAACRRLAGRDIVGVIVYGPGEEEDARRLHDQLGELSRLAPPTSLPALAALLHGARLFVGGDSGPLHMACAVGCPVVGIYGPTDPQVNRPWGVPHVAVSPPGREYTGIKRLDRASSGFAGLRPEHVEAAVDELLSQQPVS